jgi:hypothetical protein
MLLLGMAAGCKSLAEVEALSENLALGTGQLVGSKRRVPDTTLRDLLSSYEPAVLSLLLHRVTRAAHRRRALLPDGVPFGVLSLDGKNVTVCSVDDGYSQRHSDSESGGLPSLGSSLRSQRSTKRPSNGLAPAPRQAAMRAPKTSLATCKPCDDSTSARP